jgi:hypothetical protein
MLYHHYNEYRIFIQPLDPGWHAMIQPPGCDKRVPGPSSRDPLGQKQVLADAKQWIDDGKIIPSFSTIGRKL